MYSVILQNINHSYGKKQVLSGINLQVKAGSIYGLLGPSGCGKSTVVKIMAGILAATSGEVTVLGKKMPQLSLMAKIGYMAQSDALYPTLTAQENLNFFGALYGMSKTDIAARSVEVLNMVGLADKAGQYVNSFSSGMKRRLSLAITLLHRPQIIILDEPTVGIDPLLRKSIWQELRQIAAEGVTIFLTTHVMDEAEKCNHLAMMRDGIIIAEDTPQNLITKIGANSMEEAFIYYGGMGK